MEAVRFIEGSGCDHRMAPGDPFCRSCGRLSPGLVCPGDKAVELQDVPSERIRGELVRLLRIWFPRIDSLAAGDQLKAGRARLIRGIDEDSGNRILTALKDIKVNGRLVPEQEADSPLKRFLNPGLGLSVVFLVLAVILRGWFGGILAILALAPPFVWSALVPARQRQAIVAGWEERSAAGDWTQLAAHYAKVTAQSEEEARGILRSITGQVFELQRLLTADSLASVAAGAEEGALYLRLTDVLRTAVDIVQRLSESSGEDRAALQGELRGLNDSVNKTMEWFRGLEADQIRRAGDLTRELDEAAESIDRILQDVRPATRGAGPSPVKTRV